MSNFWELYAQAQKAGASGTLVGKGQTDEKDADAASKEQYEQSYREKKAKESEPIYPASTGHYSAPRGVQVQPKQTDNASTVTESQLKQDLAPGNGQTATASSGLDNTAINAGGNYTATASPVLQQSGAPVQQLTQVPMPTLKNADGTDKSIAQYQAEVNAWRQANMGTAPVYQAPELRKVMTYEDILNMNKPSEDDLAERKKAKARATIAGIGDAVTALSNIIGTMNGGKSITMDPTKSLSATAVQRYNDLIKKQEEDRKAAMELAWKGREADRADNKDAEEKAEKEYERKHTEYKEAEERKDKTAEALRKAGENEQAQRNWREQMDENKRQFDVNAKLGKERNDISRAGVAVDNKRANTDARRAAREEMDTEQTVNRNYNPDGTVKDETTKIHKTPSKTNKPKKKVKKLGIHKQAQK